MVSYFVPRGRFLVKAGNFRQAYQKQQQHQQHQHVKWPMLRHFRQTFSTTTKTAPTAPSNQTDIKVNTLIQHRVYGKSGCTNAQQEQQQQQQQQRHTRSIWSKWTGFLLRLAPMGLCVFGVIEWQLHKFKCNHQQVPRMASTFQSKIYCSLPLRLLSRCWGWLASCYIPVTFRPYIYGSYSSAFNVNLEEALYPDYNYYDSLAEFFTRPLRADVRPIDQKSPLVSPADGKVLHFGSATNLLIEQVKGVNYSIEAFLGSDNSATHIDYVERLKANHDRTTTLYQCVIYLAPGDYHRFHSPAEWQPNVRRHFAGELLSVSPKIATWLPDLFCLNERVVYLGKWNHGFFSYTAVGATNVGSVQIYMDENLKTNRWVGFNIGAHKRREEYDEQQLASTILLKKGDLVGQFNMGSTIVLLFEAPKNFKFNIEAGQKIRVGESLGCVV